jgi:hypothetical protein
MEQRILFKKGKQREFLDLVVKRLNCISVRGILQFGFDTRYDCLKNYYCERRLISRSFFENLCYVAKIDKNKLKFKIIDGNFGQVKGGRAFLKESSGRTGV